MRQMLTDMGDFLERFTPWYRQMVAELMGRGVFTTELGVRSLQEAVAEKSRRGSLRDIIVERAHPDPRAGFYSEEQEVTIFQGRMYPRYAEAARDLRMFCARTGMNLGVAPLPQVFPAATPAGTFRNYGILLDHLTFENVISGGEHQRVLFEVAAQPGGTNPAAYAVADEATFYFRPSLKFTVPVKWTIQRTNPLLPEGSSLTLAADGRRGSFDNDDFTAAFQYGCHCARQPMSGVGEHQYGLVALHVNLPSERLARMNALPELYDALQAAAPTSPTHQ